MLRWSPRPVVTSTLGLAGETHSPFMYQLDSVRPVSVRSEYDSPSFVERHTRPPDSATFA
jgi:hypothetical protein